MKKKLLLLFSLLLLAVTLCSCNVGSLICDHEYTEEVTPATCLAQGEKVKTCTLCGKVTVSKIAKKSHEFSAWQETKAQSCTEDGVKTRVCSLCGTEENETLERFGHSFGEYKTVKEASDTENGLQERRCERCKLVEQKIIQSLNYIDDSLFLIDFDESRTYTVKSREELYEIANAAIFNRAEAVHFETEFDYEKIEELSISDNTKTFFDYRMQASRSGNSLTLTYTYQPEPSIKAVSPRYEQLPSANYAPTVSKRAADYDGFKINDSVVSYKVSTSDQLYYALECRVKPLPVEGSAAERIYGKIKDVLREMIDDDMTDIEKARVIYDWLIMNITYDKDLYSSITGSSEELKKHNGFYLEGVFDDGIAVCDGISKAFVAMSNVEGIPCVRVSGNSVSGSSGVGHAWNKIYLDGKWYIADATSGGTIVGEKEIYSLEFFLITDNEMEKYYVSDEYTALKCETEYNPYTDLITDETKGYDLYIESYEELCAAMNYLSKKEAKTTLQIKFENVDMKSQIGSACGKAGIMSYSLVGDGSITTVCLP